jgi:HlyD family secretion protein
MRRRITAVLLVVAASAIGATVWSRYATKNDEATLTLYGNVDIREVELAFRVPGRLLEMSFDEGDTVQAGQRVARIDPEPYRESLAVAAARVKQAGANLEKLESGTRPREVQRARADVSEAQALFDNAERDLARQGDLLASRATSETAVDIARTRRDETAARLASAREALALAQEGFRPEEIAAARASLEAAIAEREVTQTQLDDTELLTPSSGTLIARVREPGSILAQGASVYSLSLRDPIYVRAYVSEPELGKIAPGMAVTVTTDSSDKAYAGQVGFIASRAEFTPKTVQTVDLRTDLVYRVRIVVRNGDEGLRQGMPVTILVPVDAGTTGEGSN